MHFVPAIAFLAAAVLCSLVGRILLINAAHAVSTRWLFTVLFAPFGPVIFGMKCPEATRPTRYWRMATGPLLLLFFLDGGSTESIRALPLFGKATNVRASAGNTDFHLPVPSKVVAAALGKTDEPAKTTPAALAKPAAPAAAVATATPAPAATPSAAVAAAMSTMSAAPKVQSPEERMEANRREFARLAEWYDTLKHERGYLRKGDTQAVEDYNADAAKYQTALQLAKSEQVALARLTAKK